MDLVNFILHVDQHLANFVTHYGVWIYALLFLIIFVETGVVAMPFLPGDSLLFAAGALAAGGHMNPFILSGLLFVAAVLGDNCNYFVGRTLGPKVYALDSRWIKREYLEKTQTFFDKYGTQAIILARFMPIIRTFTPFVAGVGKMPYPRFLAFDIAGGLLWINSCLWAGYFLGNLPFFKENFSAVVLCIVGISIAPAVVAWLRSMVFSAEKQ